jgi:hypothetical protein
VQADGDAQAGERTLAFEALAYRPQHGHLPVGPGNSGRTGVREDGVVRGARATPPSRH